MDADKTLPRCGEEGARSITPLLCAVYTRKSTEEGLNQEFNSLEAQREAAEAYIASQRQLGWMLVSERYDDGGYTGGNLERPALQRLLGDVNQGNIDCVLVYKVDRLSRSLLDFARLMEIFELVKISSRSQGGSRNGCLKALRAQVFYDQPSTCATP